jgi:hypothetical protein
LDDLHAAQGDVVFCPEELEEFLSDSGLTHIAENKKSALHWKHALGSFV